MRLPVFRILVLVTFILGHVRCGAEPARPIEPIQLRLSGKPLELPSPALFDGREVYLPLDAVRAMKCRVVMPEKEDYAVVASPTGVRREIALARLRRAPMVPLTALAPLLKLQYKVADGVCDIRYTTSERVAAPAPEQRAPSQSRKPAPNAAGGPAKSSSAERPPTVTSPVTGVQTPDTLDGSPTTVADRTTAPVASPVQDGPPVAPVPPKPGVVARAPSWLRDIVCEAIDPAQTRLLLVADGRLRPTVRMSASQGELTVDLPGTGVGTSQTEWTFDNPLVAGARLVPGSVAGVPRLVFRLRRLVTYRDRPVLPDGHEILIRLPKLVGRRFEEMCIMVDPGHGGPSATGCSAMVGGRRVYEKDLTLAIARKVVERLKKAGLSVHMTRASDVAVSLSERPAMANAMPADVFVSIHVDDAPGNSRASGPTAYYHGNDENSRALGLSIVEGVAAAGGLPSRGARSDLSRFRTGMAVLRRAEMPAVLIEVAYISNPSDRAKLMTAEFQTVVANAIADGIRRYVEGKLPGAPPVPTAGGVSPQKPEGL